MARAPATWCHVSHTVFLAARDHSHPLTFNSILLSRLKKNALLKKRHWFGTLLELITPLLLIGVIVFGWSLSKVKYTPAEIYADKQLPLQNLFQGVQVVVDISRMPQNPFLNISNPITIEFRNGTFPFFLPTNPRLVNISIPFFTFRNRTLVFMNGSVPIQVPIINGTLPVDIQLPYPVAILDDALRNVTFPAGCIPISTSEFVFFSLFSVSFFA